MVRRARAKHPHLTFVEGDAHDLDLGETFDVVVLSDLVNDLWSIEEVLSRVRAHSTRRTRVVLNFYNRVWQLPLAATRSLGRGSPTLDQSWVTPEDVENLLTLSGFEVVRRSSEILWPLGTPLIAPLLDRFAVRFWPFRLLGLSNFLVARPVPDGPPPAERLPRVSVVVPARNEAGNVPAIFARTPEMGGGTELILVEGGSTDGTWEEILRAAAASPGRRCVTLRQTGRGKGDAVRAGFDAATGDVLMILDADLTVPPEELPGFYAALVSGKAEFVNGVRLVYPMEKRAMRFLNLVANRLFGLTFSWLLSQPVKDTLCGTKVLWAEDYRRIAANRAYFGDFDPFGDFDLLFGAAKQCMRILDRPVRYRERAYGETNISRFRHGWLLVRMTLFAARRLKFV